MTAPQMATPGWSDLVHSGRFGQVVLIAFGVWLHAADELMVSTITPVMVAEIGGGRYLAWLTALYEIGSIVAGAMAALLVLNLGLRRTMAGAAFVYLAGCLVSGMAPTMEIMLAGRLLQGLGGGAMVATAFVAVHRILPDALTARVYATISLVWGASAFSGPMIGAVFAEFGVWRWGFLFYAAQAACFGAVALLRLEEGEAGAAAKTALHIPWRIALLAGGALCVAFAGVEPAPLRAAAFIIAGIALIAAFLYRDAIAPAASRMLPPSAWNIARPAGAAIVMVVFLSAATTALITYGPVAMAHLHGLTAIEAGAILLLESIGWSVVSIAVAGLAEGRHRQAIAAGFLIACAAILALAFAMPFGPVALIAAAAFCMGGGFGMAWAFMVRLATKLVPDGERERMASAIPTTQRLGYALGAAFAGILANATGFAEQASEAAIRHSTIAIYAGAIFPAAIGLVAMARLLAFRRPGETAGNRSA